MAKKKKAKIGRPRIPIDLKLLERLAEVGCSQEEIASMLRRSGLQIDAVTIRRRLKDPVFATAWQDGMNAMKVKLRSRMLAQAMMMNSGGVQQSQFLAKQYLGMKDKVEHSGQIDGNIEVSESVHDRLARKLDTLAKRLHGRAASAAEAVGPAALPEKSVG